MKIPQIILGVIYAACVYLFFSLPFLESFAFAPFVVFIHRFSLTIPIGSDPKTLQLFVFIIPVLFVKAILEYKKRYNLADLKKEPIIWLIGLLLLSDTIHTVFSINQATSLFTLAVRVLIYMTFLASSIWIKIICDNSQKESQLNVIYKVVRQFLISLGIFVIVNAAVSFWQFFDCSIINKQCTVWAFIDEILPNRLLPVGHQRFSDELNIVRAVGFFGDVNFNGMFTLLSILILGGILVTMLVIRKNKDQENTKFLLFLAVCVFLSALTYILTLSRSAIVAFIVISIIAGTALLPAFLKYINFPKIRESLFKWGMIIFGFLVTIVVLLAFSLGGTDPNQNKVLDGITGYVMQITNKNDPSANERLIIMGKTLEIAKSNLFFGTGIGTFKFAYEKAYPGFTNYDPHSTYVTLLEEEGIIGLVIYIGVLGYIWYKSLQFLNYVRKRIATGISAKDLEKKKTFQEITLLVFIALLGLALPFMTIATVTYYGFFLPMSWWWGSVALVKIPQLKA